MRKFRIKKRFFGSIGLMTSLEKLGLALNYVRTKQIKKLFHITLEATIKSRLLNGPLDLLIEPTSLCTARCALCTTPQEKLDRSMKYFPINKYKEIIDKTKSSLRSVTFFVAGDPFLNQNLCKMIDYATKNRLRTFVSTNGTLLSQQKIVDLLETNLDELYICLDGAKKESHEINRKRTNFKLICNNIHVLTLERRKRKKLFPQIFIQTLITRYNEDELDEIAELAKKLGADGVFFKTLCIEKGCDENLVKEFLPRKKHLSRYEIINGQIRMKMENRMECEYLKKALVLCDGKLALCCYDYNGEYAIGNAFSRDIMNLWKSKKYENFRKRMKRKEFEMCKDICNCGLTDH